ncbi:metallophosphoesterase [Allosphingosinicella indica]|uniref:Calcineurin-like phosphoesterase domain-containing protein n=1 Tax=Allosphingosinicella indica TaxID=941907 RepID=A0A1X7FYT0_9SPHN|nr:metallophosphoesterase [Allosphingosinicella indica]SMF61294.1 hypothetical protein SAMN06295910_0279 [Allosphingosinicella indica]
MRVLVALVVATLFVAALGYSNAIAEPVVRRAFVGMPDWSDATPPLRIALLSDLHVAGPDMPPQRLAAIVAQVNAQRPDMVLLAGDFVSDKRVATRRYSADEAVAPLGKLAARYGVTAVLGNHDHWRDADAFRRALPAVGVLVLDNQVARRGPLLVAGSDDDFTGHSDVPRLTAAVASARGPVIALSHSPDITPELPESVRLVFAGHTHCGQIRLPWIGAVATMSRHGERYACGLVRDGNRTVIVSAGLGTSLLPLRFGTPPDFWIVTIGPEARQAR